jgi:hypothetical protein
LYKLLYNEIDEDLTIWPMKNYTIYQILGRIGLSKILKRTVQSQNIVSVEVQNTLALGPSAQILFDDGSTQEACS